MRLSKAEQIVFEEWAESFREYNRLVSALTSTADPTYSLRAEQLDEVKAKLVAHRDVSVRLVATLDVNRVPVLIQDNSATLEQVLDSQAVPKSADASAAGDK